MILQLYKQILLRRRELLAAALQLFQPGVLLVREAGTTREEHFELHAVVNEARLWQASFPRRSQDLLNAAALALDDALTVFCSHFVYLRLRSLIRSVGRKV